MASMQARLTSGVLASLCKLLQTAACCTAMSSATHNILYNVHIDYWALSGPWARSFHESQWIFGLSPAGTSC